LPTIFHFFQIKTLCGIHTRCLQRMDKRHKPSYS
jgi:hypothetical protein